MPVEPAAAAVSSSVGLCAFCVADSPVGEKDVQRVAELFRARGFAIKQRSGVGEEVIPWLKRTFELLSSEARLLVVYFRGTSSSSSEAVANDLADIWMRSRSAAPAARLLVIADVPGDSSPAWLNSALVGNAALQVSGRDATPGYLTTWFVAKNTADHRVNWAGGSSTEAAPRFLAPWSTTATRDRRHGGPLKDFEDEVPGGLWFFDRPRASTGAGREGY